MAHQRGQPRMGRQNAGTRRCGIDFDQQWQGIDEHPQRPVGPLAALHAPEQHRAEHDLLAAAGGRQHLAPGQMEQARRRDAEPTGRGAQAVTQIIRQRPGNFLDIAAVVLHVLQTERQGRFVDSPQHVAEERFMLLLADAQACLGHMIAIRHRFAQCRVVTEQVRLHLLQHHLECGMVQHQVVEQQGCHRTLTRRVVAVHQTDQRCASQVQAIVARVETRLQLVQHVAVDRVEGQRLDHQFSVTPDDLHRLFKPLPEERGAQDIVTFDHLLQGPGKGLQALDTVESQPRLQDIGIALLGAEVVVENAFLQRRQRIDILHVGGTARHAGNDVIDARLVQFDQ